MKDTKQKISAEKADGHFLLVAIGAAKGGLEAMADVLGHLSGKTGLAYFYVQSTEAPTGKEIVSHLSAVTSMPVLEARNKLKVLANHIYVIPSKKLVSIVGGFFKVTLPGKGREPAMPVNRFFTNLAEHYKEGTVGVLLSGDTTDGVLGMRAIKMAGGITLVQDASASFQSMPRNVAGEGLADLVLSIVEIAEELEKMGRQKDIYDPTLLGLNEEDISNRDEDLINILQLLHKSTRLDFSQYKMSTIKRRIMRRMLLFKMDSLKDYGEFLSNNKNEINQLYQDLLINVTAFFRDPDACEHLKKTLLPSIIRSKEPKEPIRIWIPACSTGQEAYSLAILLMEVLGDRAATTPVQIFATDISDIAINKARLGVYSKADVQDIAPKRLQSFFVKMDGSYRIVKSIRDLCVFTTQNVFHDPPFSRLDLVSCCNLLIYLDNNLQKKLIATFHYALNNNGYLVLGKSETVGTSSHLFLQQDKKLKVYAKKNDSSVRSLFEMNHRLPDMYKDGELLTRRAVVQKSKTDETDLEKAVDLVLLKKYTPANVIVNQDFDIIQFRGATGLFLEPSPGKASLNLLKMARSGLGFELRNIIHKAKRSGEAEKKSGLELNLNGKVHRVSIEAVPIRSDGEEQYFMVVFEEMVFPPQDARQSSLKDKRVQQLEAELTALKEDMRSIVEAQEAANEELQSANEEIVSSNEELQSINEELETSKEEIESSNEELITINQELQVRNEQMAEVQEYAVSVFTTIREGLLILDSNLCVKAGNSAFYKTFHLGEDEVEGRLVYELANKEWNLPELHELLDGIIPRDGHYEGFEIAHHFRGIGEKILLLNAKKVIQEIHHQQLILLAIKDVTEHRKGQRILAEREAWFRNMADNAPVMIWVTGLDNLCTFCNRDWLEYRGISQEAATGKKWTEGVHPDDAGMCNTLFDKALAEKGPFVAEYRLRRHDGEYRWILNRAKPAFTHEGKFTGYIGSSVDIHEPRIMKEDLEKRVEQRTHALMEANIELERSNSELEQFAYVASHDLQEPLRKILTFIDRMQKGHDKDFPPETAKYFSKINDASNRMIRLIDDLLNFSRISRLGKRYVKTDLNSIVQGIIADMDLLIAEKKAIVTVEKLPVIQAIPLQMTQLFHNLVSNALKFTVPDRTPVIHIGCHLLSKEEKQLEGQGGVSLFYEITVKDNGIGFRQEYAEQIFTIFQRLHDRSQYTGTGIGLSLVRKIVTNHNGKVYASGKEGEGAAFRILLPAKQENPS